MKNFMEYNFNIEKIVVACYVPPKGGTPIHKNRSSHGLVLHTSGERYYDFDGTKVPAMPNDILYLPKNSDYIVKSIISGGCYAINFDISETIDLKPFSFRVKNASSFLNSFTQAERVWRTKSSGYELKCKAELYNTIYNLRKEFELGYISKGVSDKIKPAIDYIHQEYINGNIEIARLARLCGISETYFRRIFQKTFGISPIKYINNLKITRAKELISSGLYTVSEVAELSGFYDECYFSREFKKTVGICPSEYS